MNVNITRMFDSPTIQHRIDDWISTWDVLTVVILVGTVHFPAKYVIRYTLQYLRLRTLRNIAQLSSEMRLREHVNARFVAQCSEETFQKFGRPLGFALTFLVLYLKMETPIFFWLMMLMYMSTLGHAVPCFGIVMAVASLGELVQLKESLPEQEYNHLWVHYTGPPLVLMPAQ